MNNQINKLIPEFRFPEFMNEGEWEYLNGNELFDTISNKNHNCNLPILAITQEQGAIPRNLINYNVVVAEKSLESYKVVELGDFIISLRSFQGGIEYSYYKGICSPAYIILRKKNENSENEFYKHYFKTDSYIRNLNKNLEGLRDGKMVSYSQFSEILIPNPNPLEQQKIASCLSSLDELLTAHADKLETLKTYKEALMQNLFPQDGEKVPKIRFKEFENGGEWIFESLNKVYSFLVTNSFSRENLNYENGKVKNIHYGDIHTKFSTLFDLTKEKVPYINPEISIDRIRQECYCKEGDIVFADASEDLNDVGKSIEIISLNNEKLLSGLHTLLARQIEPKLVVGFGGYLFQSNKIRSQIKKEAQGAKVLGVSGTRLSNIEIYYPNNVKEQEKIANTLSSLDDLIKEQVDKSVKLKLHKKGLMQGLFPKMKN